MASGSSGTTGDAATEEVFDSSAPLVSVLSCESWDFCDELDVLIFAIILPAAGGTINHRPVAHLPSAISIA